MGRSCSVCQHPRKVDIDDDLANNAPFRAVATTFNLDKDAVRRHAHTHLPKSLANARTEYDLTSARNLLWKVSEHLGRAEKIYERSEETGDAKTALAALKEVRGTLGLIARISAMPHPDHDDRNRELIQRRANQTVQDVEAVMALTASGWTTAELMAGRREEDESS